MTAVLGAVVAATGVYLLYTAVAFGWRRIGSGRSGERVALRRRVDEWLAQAGLADVAPRQFLTAVGVLGLVGAVVAYLVFGGAVPVAAGALVAGLLPIATYRSRRSRLIEDARQAWPRLIEEIRLQTGGLGRSIPQAIFEVGRGAPESMRDAFGRAEQSWLVSTDLGRALDVLKARLADPTADMVCETLLVAHEVGSGQLDQHLRALAEDRALELEGRRDALAKQAGARFARRFVLFVPLGMAFAGLSIGDGRAAYETPAGQLAVATGLVALIACWIWAGRIMRLPEPERVFGRTELASGREG